MAEILHLLCDIGRLWCEEVLVVSQHHIVDEELTHRLKGDLLQVHLTTLHSEQTYVPRYKRTEWFDYLSPTI